MKRGQIAPFVLPCELFGHVHETLCFVPAAILSCSSVLISLLLRQFSEYEGMHDN